MSDYFLDTSITKIQEASENNKLVVFVGAGVSANSGIPTWNELIKEFAQDLGEFDVDRSPDLYMKIPQYYFNERGEKEYFEKMNEVFSKKKYKPNPIHKEIFKLKPTHIITTNYDTLLEEAAIEEGQFFHTVKHDLDLPYDNFNKTIIKMHGDFENRNIVLKEDDYLNYSSNFTLIESYIKALIATNTVLFIGYSINDSNFNLIFQWVKNILRNHFQPAYLIESSKKYSRMEHAYYKNRGINILYYDEISNMPNNNIFDISNWRGNRLFDVLSYFNSFDKMTKMSDLEIIYNKISCFEKLNFIMPEQIVKNLGLKSVGYDLFGDRTLTILNGENSLSRVFSNHDTYKDNWIFQKIIMIFKKANIQGVSREKQIIFSIDNQDNYLDNLRAKIIDQDSLIDPIDINSFTSLIGGEDYFLMLKQAFAYCECDKFYDAYKYYKTISLKAFQDKEFLIYYISEFNRKHVGKFLVNGFYNVNNNIEMELKELDLENIYANLPNGERKSIEFLKELQDFNLIYKVQNKLNKEVDTLKETKRTVENGGFSFNSSLNKNFHMISNIWLFVESNYLCINKYKEIQSLYLSFVEGIFASYSTQSNNSKSFFNKVSLNKIEKLDLYEVYIIITKLKTSDFENVLVEYNLRELKLENSAFEYIMKVLDKVIDNILNNHNKKTSEHYFYNLLVLTSKTNLDFEQANLIAGKLLLLLNERIYLNEFKYINKFIVAVANKEILAQSTVLDYLEKYLETYMRNSRIIEFDNNGLYNNLTNIYVDYNEHPINKDIISSYVILIKKSYEEKEYDILYTVFENLIVPILKAISEEYKNIIIKVIESLVEKIKRNEGLLQFNELNFYYMISINDVITADKDINKKIVEDTVVKIRNENKAVKIHPDPIERNLNILTDLYRRNKLKKEELEEFVDVFGGYSDYFDLVFNTKNLKLTDIDLLSYLKEEEVESLMNNKGMKECIYSLFEKKLRNLPFEKYEDIFGKLYAKKF
ncbi:SIR2 family protein [Bacillus velezensis]|uniref:SIR2 family protein n=1 Tax=Bacillus velezensis TaxID=492670 RepID=UPI00100AD2B5|nr:SIR2 family protein [Bacillus velezensis]MBU5240132.1 SIR2 family protein [Bacillus velezensis]MEC2167078.1 SIR2 family protein [Bacillus velezensis]MED1775345.1 SIR2 family protein [Bacillus velezensis]RXK26116.1 SIR2 family protein [Bacillus velezensis]